MTAWPTPWAARRAPSRPSGHTAAEQGARLLLQRLIPSVTLAAGMAPLGLAHAQRLAVDQVFIQAGVANGVNTIVVGAAKDWTWQRALGDGTLTGYWEASIGRWYSKVDDQERGSTWVTQIGLTPVFRWGPHPSPTGWFMEAGVGANVLLPVFRSRDKQFSTAFNFGDHVAVGKRFGANGEHEFALRLQHFSNAGIRRPNPGENFLQLRYAWRY